MRASASGKDLPQVAALGSGLAHGLLYVAVPNVADRPEMCNALSSGFLEPPKAGFCFCSDLLDFVVKRFLEDQTCSIIFKDREFVQCPELRT